LAATALPANLQAISAPPSIRRPRDSPLSAHNIPRRKSSGSPNTASAIPACTRKGLPTKTRICGVSRHSSPQRTTYPRVYPKHFNRSRRNKMCNTEVRGEKFRSLRDVQAHQRSTFLSPPNRLSAGHRYASLSLANSVWPSATPVPATRTSSPVRLPMALPRS
jgi:hypothetical protein